jgi:Family of unknown function (DUF6455)
MNRHRRRVLRSIIPAADKWTRQLLVQMIRIWKRYGDALTWLEPSSQRTNLRCGLMYLKSRPRLLRYWSQSTGKSAMPSSENSDVRELQVYKMMERLGIELGAGVIPRYGLMYASAVRACRTCGSVHACAAWLGSAPASCIAPEFCPNADIFVELELEGQTVPRGTEKQ